APARRAFLATVALTFLPITLPPYRASCKECSMLVDYFKSSLILERFRSGSAGPHLDAFTEWLDERGYRRVSVRRHVREVVHFAAWAKKTGIRVEGFNRDALD